MTLPCDRRPEQSPRAAGPRPWRRAASHRIIHGSGGALGPPHALRPAGVAELADAPHSKCGELALVWVRVPPSALEMKDWRNSASLSWSMRRLVTDWSRALLSGLEQGVHPLGRLALHVHADVRIAVERNGDPAVA